MCTGISNRTGLRRRICRASHFAKSATEGDLHAIACADITHERENRASGTTGSRTRCPQERGAARTRPHLQNRTFRQRRCGVNHAGASVPAAATRISEGHAGTQAGTQAGCRHARTRLQLGTYCRQSAASCGHTGSSMMALKRTPRLRRRSRQHGACQQRRERII